VECFVSVLTVLEFPDEKLRKKADPVLDFDSNLNQLVDNMFETMYEYKGVGLAATQVDRHQRIIVIDISEEKNQPLCLINPQIVEKEGAEVSEEGCLSVPGFFEKVERAEKIKLTASNPKGENFELQADDFLAVCIQHEIDHLDGKLFVDYLSSLKRQRIKKKLEKQHKLERDKGTLTSNVE
jgi:peptide deformylase